MSNWMVTISGRKFHPADPRPEDIALGDIAWALSNLCRFGGHTRRFYSVAEHSVLVSRCVPPEHALQALLHDATEAYLVDIPRPVKVMLANYADLEDRAWRAIAEAFDVDVEMHESVKHADNAVLMAEKAALLNPDGPQWDVGVPAANVTVLALSPQGARKLFMERYEELTYG